jgi:hypothetical protein
MNTRWSMISAGALAQTDDPERIQPYAANPFYWQYKGQPVPLLGGSDSDARTPEPGPRGVRYQGR